MPTTLTGVWGAPLEVLKDMVAASATFLAWTGAANAAAAESGHVRIYTDYQFENYPLALVNWAGGARQTAKGVSAGRPSMSPRVDGSLCLEFHATYTQEQWADPQETMKAFVSKVLGVIADLQGMSGGEGMLPITEYEPETECPDFGEFEDGREEPVLLWRWKLS